VLITPGLPKSCDESQYDRCVTDFLVTHCPEQVLRQCVSSSAAFSYIRAFCMDSHRCNKDDFHDSYVRLIPLTLLMTLTIDTTRRLGFFQVFYILFFC